MTTPRARVDEFLGRARNAARSSHLGARLCDASAALVGGGSAAIMLMGVSAQAASFGFSDGLAAELEELQFTLGEGPGFDAYASGTPSLAPQLGDPASHRWPAFAPVATRLGVGAAFGFPLRLGAIRLGALDVYRAHPGELSAEQARDAVIAATVITEAVLALHAGSLPDQLPQAIELGQLLRAEIHQAAGMVSEQLGIPVTDALIRLRAHAYAEDRPINKVAHEVVDRWLRIE
jgi:hypothetical protein